MEARHPRRAFLVLVLPSGRAVWFTLVAMFPSAQETEMATGDYYIWPAQVTKTDDGHEVSRKPARLYVNDGSERSWEFATTAEAKDRADLWFDVTEWDRDDLGTWWSK